MLSLTLASIGYIENDHLGNFELNLKLKTCVENSQTKCKLRKSWWRFDLKSLFTQRKTSIAYKCYRLCCEFKMPIETAFWQLRYWLKSCFENNVLSQIVKKVINVFKELVCDITCNFALFHVCFWLSSLMKRDKYWVLPDVWWEIGQGGYLLVGSLSKSIVSLDVKVPRQNSWPCTAAWPVPILCFCWVVFLFIRLFAALCSLVKVNWVSPGSLFICRGSFLASPTFRIVGYKRFVVVMSKEFPDFNRISPIISFREMACK